MSEIVPAITAGLTLDFTVTLTAYQPPEWELSIHLRGAGSIDLTATPDGTAHRVQADAATTAAWEPGTYWYTVRVTDGANVHEVEEGTVQVAPDLAATDGGYDGRTHAQKVLDAVEAVIEGRATLDQERYRINNRELYRTAMADLLKLRDKYREEVRRQRAAKKKGNSLLGRRVRVYF